MVFDRLIQAPLGPPIRGRDQLIIHLHELIEGLVVRLHEKADHDGRAVGHFEETQALDTGLRGVAGEGFLEIVVEPCQIEGEYARSLDAIQFGGQVVHRLGGRHPGRSRERVEGRKAVVGLHLHQGSKAGRQGGW